jgi:hypothetical protein
VALRTGAAPGERKKRRDGRRRIDVQVRSRQTSSGPRGYVSRIEVDRGRAEAYARGRGHNRLKFP